ncbi:MAG: hypothetical protein SVV80_05495 [Planctomycetota bacterium]|nr:hypothetical protein [Planctomycetota bacterium]
MLLNRRTLGLAVTSRSIIAVEVGSSNGQCKAFRAAKFTYPEETSLEEPEKMGKVLKEFLRREGFSARRCVIGMEAKWLTAREKALPPDSGDSLVGILSIMAEREFASDRDDLVFDYTGPTGSDEGELVLLVAASREHVNLLQAIAQAAGLRAIAITSSAMTLACSSTAPDVSERVVLYLTQSGAELVVQSKGAVRMVRRFSLQTPEDPSTGKTGVRLDGLVSELHRVMSLLPGDQVAQQERQVHIWNGAGLDNGSLEVLAKRIGSQAGLRRSPVDLDSVGISGGLQRDEITAAACLGAAGTHGRRPVVDFLHSKLTPPGKAAAGRKAVWIAGVVAVVIVICLGLLLNWKQTQSEIVALEERLGVMKPDVSQARDIIDKTTFAQGWYDRQPKHLDCLRELTLAFPQEGRIWTTSLSVRDDMQVLFSGKAVDKTAVLEVLDRLKSNSVFSQVKSIYLRESGESQREVTFAISLIYLRGRQR